MCLLLAIDYEVVVNGVVTKYKNTIAEDKGYEYFEKLIQVVFRLPEKMNKDWSISLKYWATADATGHWPKDSRNW